MLVVMVALRASVAGVQAAAAPAQAEGPTTRRWGGARCRLPLGKRNGGVWPGVEAEREAWWVDIIVSRGLLCAPAAAGASLVGAWVITPGSVCWETRYFAVATMAPPSFGAWVVLMWASPIREEHLLSKRVPHPRHKHSLYHPWPKQNATNVSITSGLIRPPTTYTNQPPTPRETETGVLCDLGRA